MLFPDTTDLQAAQPNIDRLKSTSLHRAETDLPLGDHEFSTDDQKFLDTAFLGDQDDFAGFGNENYGAAYVNPNLFSASTWKDQGGYQQTQQYSGK